MKVVHGAGQAGFIGTLRGHGGGLRPARPPAEISVGEVVRRTEEHLALVDRLMRVGRPGRGRTADSRGCAIAGCCRLQGALHEALEAFLAVRDRTSLADLLPSPGELRRRLDLPEPAHQPEAAGSRASSVSS